MLKPREEKAALKVFAERLKEARVARGMRQKQLADQVGISNKTLYNVEASQNWPSMPVYIALARALSISPGMLLRERAEEKEFA